MSSARIIFEPNGRHVKTDLKKTLLKIAKREGIRIRSECGGKGRCGKCRVVIHQQNALTPPTSLEMAHLTDEERLQGLRLACQVKIVKAQNIHVTIPLSSRLGKRRIQLDSVLKPIHIEPAITAELIQVPPLDLHHPIPDDERLLLALDQFFSAKRKIRWKIALATHERIPNALRAARGQITVVLRNNQQILDVKAGDQRENIYGAALDIGTSKLVLSLYSLVSGKLLATSGIENPQISYGEDIMTRLSFAAVSLENRKVLQHTVIKAINELFNRIKAQTQISLDYIYELVVVGNTVMTSLFLGLDTTHLGYGPFIAPFRGPMDVSANQLGLTLSSKAFVHVMPNVAGYVGADAIADVLATRLHRQKKMGLLIDIGTNSEVILGNRNGVYATSCAAGPAFEGAQIECGMKAVTGAIERVSISPESYEVTITTIDNASPIGICGSGVVDAVAQLAEAELLTRKGHFSKKAKSVIQIKGKKRFFPITRGDSMKHPLVTLSEHDVSQLLLAKAAIQSGYTVLLNEKNLSPRDIGYVFIAGAFGNYLNPLSAKRIGLIPPVSTKQVEFVGNTALGGASIALLTNTQRTQATRLARDIHFIDLAQHPSFSKVYADSLFLPDL